MNGVILLPTLNRPEFLRNFIKSYEETKAEVVVKVLIDDQDFLNNEQKYTHLFKEAPPSIHPVKTGIAVSMGDKVRFIWPEIENTYGWVGILNDDHYCITKHWDKICDEMIDGANMISTNDGFWNFGFRCAGLTAWSMPLLKACGFPIFPDGIYHYFIDDIWKAIGESSGCWRETMRINIEHRHVFLGKMEGDETFKKVNDQAAAQAAIPYFKDFMEKEFPEVVKRIIELRKDHILKNKFV